MDKYEIDAFDEKIMEAFIVKTRQSEAKIGELEQNIKVKEAELEYVAQLYDNDKKLLTLELENAIQKFTILEGKFNEYKHSNSTKDEELEILNNKIDELNTKIAPKDEEINSLKLEISDRDEEINNLKIEISDLNSKVSSRDKEVSELNKELSKIEELSEKIKIKEKLIEEQSTTIREIEAELNELKSPEILTTDTTSGDRLICAKCGAAGKDIKTIEDKSKPLSYMGNIPMYAKYKVCKKCGHQF